MRLRAIPQPRIGHELIDPIYQGYIRSLVGTKAQWDYNFPHDVHRILWIDGLEVAERRQAIVDLVLRNPDEYLPHVTVQVGRVGHPASQTVSSLWAYALTRLDWPVFPGERGPGGEPVRVPPTQLWRLPEGGRRVSYGQLLNVVPHALSDASRLLHALSVPTLEEANLERLFTALDDLARRLDAENLHTRKESLSLSKKLLEGIEERLKTEGAVSVMAELRLPLLRDRQLECVDPGDTSVSILFDDDPGRARHVIGAAGAFRVPLARDASVNRIHSLFVNTWGADRVILASTAPINLEFIPCASPGEKFLGWLQRLFPYVDVAAEIAALLTLAGERSVRAERISGNWGAFEQLDLVFGSFEEPSVTSFYNRPKNELWLSSSLHDHEVVEATWALAGARSRDMWSSYARALKQCDSRRFLHDREISDVEIVDVAEAIGIQHPMGIKAIWAALIAARCHLFPSETMDGAATWLASAGPSAEEVARALERPDLVPVISEALGKRYPAGDFLVIRHLGVPWLLWQEAVERRGGEKYVFAGSVSRYRVVRAHLVAVAREIAARSVSVDLAKMGQELERGLKPFPPDSVQYRPLDLAGADETAWDEVRLAVQAFAPVARALGELPQLPWSAALPIPDGATRRGVNLYLEEASQREADSRASVQAVATVAERLAPFLGEQVSAQILLSDPRLNNLIEGEWAHVYCALYALRQQLEEIAPQTTKRLSSIRAFHEQSTRATLIGQLQEVQRDSFPDPLPTQNILGEQMTAGQISSDLSRGEHGVVGQRLVAAAAQGFDYGILQRARLSLASRHSSSRGDATGTTGRGAGTGRSRKEPQLIGDIGEAFVHEFLRATIGDEYGPECWVSTAREKYGLPVGRDSLGYDFKVSDSTGRLFGMPDKCFLIEVKSTSTDGSGPFPMSRAEWDEARRCHVSDGNEVYVILRVFDVTGNPRVGDVVIDPIAAQARGEIRLEDRDLWVTVAPLADAASVAQPNGVG